MPPTPYCIKAGFNTFDGHFEMHKWQDVQSHFSFSMLRAPGGAIAVELVSESGGDLASAATEGRAAAAITPFFKKFLFFMSTGSVFLFPAEKGDHKGAPLRNAMPPFLQLFMQLKQFTQRL